MILCLVGGSSPAFLHTWFRLSCHWDQVLDKVEKLFTMEKTVEAVLYKGRPCQLVVGSEGELSLLNDDHHWEENLRIVQ